jgi:hypothetical protein
MDITSFLLGYESGKTSGGGNLESVDVVLDEISGEVIAGSTGDKLNYLDETKETIKNAIISKGQTVLADDTFRSYADKISDIGVQKPWTVASGTFVPAKVEDTITHNLGSIPDLFMVWATMTPSVAGSIVFMSGYSDAVAGKAVNPKVAAASVLQFDQFNNKYYATTAYNAVSFTHTAAQGYGYPHNATETDIAVGTTSSYGVAKLEIGLTYAWLAIGKII